MRPRIVFLRHGETDWNVEYRLQGQQDTPLNGRGRDQASAVGLFLKGYFGDATTTLDQTIDFVASPLSRTRETMHLARTAMGLEPDLYATDPRLMELSFGSWETITWEDIKQRHPDEARRRLADKWNFVPPGGESYAMLAARVLPWLDGLRRETLVVAHGGVARVLMAMIGGLPKTDAPNAEIKQGRALIFEKDRYSWL